MLTVRSRVEPLFAGRSATAGRTGMSSMIVHKSVARIL